MMKCRKSFQAVGVLFGALFLSTLALSEVQTIRVQAPESPNDKRPLYYKELLNLALQMTEKEYGPYKVEISKAKSGQQRNMANLKSGRFLDLIWTMTSKDREDELLPVRIPLLRGLLGHRVCLTNKKDLSKFEGVKDLATLKSSGLVLGSGHDWPDTKILKAAGLKVFTGSDYEGLFKMLKVGRFQCYARGLNEAWVEKEIHKGKGFEVDSKVAIVYKSPIYFFVKKGNNKLAERIEKGLRASIADGSFLKVFHSYQGKYLDLASLKDRVVIRIDNPIMSPETPVNDKSLWIE